MGQLERIWIKRVRGEAMDEQATATLVAGRGLQGNVDQGGTRQVTVLSREEWAALNEGGEHPVDPSVRRANLMVSGIALDPATRGLLRIGPCRLRVHGETRPCEKMDEAREGLQAAMRHRRTGGVFAEVVEGGDIRCGDDVQWEADES